MKKFILLIIFIGFINPARADIIKKGQTGFRFLEHPVGADVMGRGTVGLALTRNANAAFINPAGLAWMTQRNDFAFNYTKGIAEINHSSAALAFNLQSFGVFALDALFMDYGDLVETRVAANENGYETLGTFSPQNYAWGLSYAKQVSDRFSFGVRVKLAHENVVDSNGVAIDGEYVAKEYNLTEAAVDVGVVYDFLYRSIRFAAVMQNFSRETRYQDHKFPLPFAVSFSLTIDPLSFFKTDWNGHDLIMAFETRHPRDFKERYKIGLEYTYHRLLVLRSGYMGNYDERGMTMGAGLFYQLRNIRFRFDYGWQYHGLFDNVHVVSFGIGY